LEKEIKNLRSQGPAASQLEQSNRDKAIASKQADFQHEKSRIEKAKTDATTASTQIETLAPQVAKFKEMLDKRATELMPAGKKYMPQAHETVGYGATSRAQRVAATATEDVYKRLSNILGRASGYSNRGNDKL